MPYTHFFILFSSLCCILLFSHLTFLIDPVGVSSMTDSTSTDESRPKKKKKKKKTESEEVKVLLCLFIVCSLWLLIKIEYTTYFSFALAEHYKQDYLCVWSHKYGKGDIFLWNVKIFFRRYLKPTGCTNKGLGARGATVLKFEKITQLQVLAFLACWTNYQLECIDNNIKLWPMLKFVHGCILEWL